jgi:hypothetical protein
MIAHFGYYYCILAYVAGFKITSAESIESSSRIEISSKELRWRPSYLDELPAAAAAAPRLEVVIKLSGGGDNDHESVWPPPPPPMPPYIDHSESRIHLPPPPLPPSNHKRLPSPKRHHQPQGQSAASQRQHTYVPPPPPSQSKQFHPPVPVSPNGIRNNTTIPLKHNTQEPPVKLPPPPPPLLVKPSESPQYQQPHPQQLFQAYFEHHVQALIRDYVQQELQEMLLHQQQNLNLQSPGPAYENEYASPSIRPNDNGVEHKFSLLADRVELLLQQLKSQPPQPPPPPRSLSRNHPSELPPLSNNDSRTTRPEQAVAPPPPPPPPIEADASPANPSIQATRVMAWIRHVLGASLLSTTNTNTPASVDIRQMVDIVNLASRVDEDTDTLPQVVVAIQDAFQHGKELCLSQLEVQLLEEFEASTDTNNDHDDYELDVPVDDQEAFEDENNAQEQDGWMHFPIPFMVDDNDEDNELDPLVVRLVTWMEHVAVYSNEFSAANFKDHGVFETTMTYGLAENFGNEYSLPPPRPPRQRQVLRFRTVQKTRTIPRRTMLSDLLDNEDEDLLDKDLSDGAFDELVSQVSLPSTMDEEYSDVESYYDYEDVSSSEEKPPTHISIPEDETDVVDEVLSLALALQLLKSRLNDDKTYNDFLNEEFVHETDASDGDYEEWDNGDDSQVDDDSLILENQDLIFVATDSNLLSKATFIGSSPTRRSSFFVEPISTMDAQRPFTTPSRQGVESTNNWKVDRTPKASLSASDRREANHVQSEYSDEVDEYEWSTMVEANKFEEEIIDGLGHRDDDDQALELSNTSPSHSAVSPTLVAEAYSEDDYARQDDGKKTMDWNIFRGSWLPRAKGKGLLEKLTDKMFKMYYEDLSDEYEREASTKKINVIVPSDNQESQDLIETRAVPSEQVVVQEEAKEVPEEEEESEDEMSLGQSASTALPSRHPRRPPPPKRPPPAELPPPPPFYHHQGINVKRSGQIPPPPPPSSSSKPSPPPEPPLRFIGIDEHWKKDMIDQGDLKWKY